MNISSLCAGVLIIGNEILSGRTTEANLQYIAKKLATWGIELKEARIIPDTPEAIIAAVRTCSKRYNYIFTTGGIGPTHDDITAEAIAAAFDAPLEFHPQAIHLLEQRYGKGNLSKSQLKMTLFPKNAALIETPSFPGAFGFTFQNVSVLAGVPHIMQAMLDSFLSQVQPASPFFNETISCEISENILAEGLLKIQEKNPETALGSYPFFQEGKVGTSLVARGRNAAQVQQVKEEVIALIRSLGSEVIEAAPEN